MNKNELPFEYIVTMKLVMAGYIGGYDVTLKCGFFNYMFPRWVHKLHLHFLCMTSKKWRNEVAELTKELSEM